MARAAAKSRSFSSLRNVAAFSALAALLASPLDLAAQPAPAAQSRDAASQELLNSERIEQRYGSYGVEVLASDAATRVSNLYSEHAGQRICRTFAVVRYAPSIDARVASEHAAILAGGSIGATFTARGWMVVKRHRYAGEIATPPRLAALMGGIGSARLAVHVYALDVVKDGVRLEYATIAEVHHPDYLGLPDLQEVYGAEAPLPTEPDATARAMLALVAEKAGASPAIGSRQP
ncbi:MAG TPA: hypothetical protein VIC71_08450 [Gammaproteobacteria bacterium]|jgi:hypothetical protein